jgi:hypothetical protein
VSVPRNFLKPGTKPPILKYADPTPGVPPFCQMGLLLLPSITNTREWIGMVENARIIIITNIDHRSSDFIFEYACSLFPLS